MDEVAKDLLAVKVTVGFEGGTLTATRGLLQAVFGAEFVKRGLTGSTTISRRAHQRQRVIGGPTTGVAAASYSLPKLASRATGSAMGGEPIQVLYGNKWWTMRLTGSHKAFNALLGSSIFDSGKVVFWRAESGRPYGPFTSKTTIEAA